MMDIQEIRAKCLELACDLIAPDEGEDWLTAIAISERFEAYITDGDVPVRGVEA